MNKIYTTKFGEANFPHLNKPDTQFNSQGIYQVKLLIKAFDAEEDINIINQIIDNEFSIQQNKQLDKKDSLLRAPLPFKSIEDGRIQFQFKSKFKPMCSLSFKNCLLLFGFALSQIVFVSFILI